VLSLRGYREEEEDFLLSFWAMPSGVCEGAACTCGFRAGSGRERGGGSLRGGRMGGSSGWMGLRGVLWFGMGGAVEGMVEGTYWRGFGWGLFIGAVRSDWRRRRWGW